MKKLKKKNSTSKIINKLKGIKPEKISQDQLRKVQDIVNAINSAKLDIGSIETRKHEILHKMAGARDELALMQEEFQKEYGTFDVDIQTGKINYPKENGEVNKKD
jgi:hypothetical protein